MTLDEAIKWHSAESEKCEKLSRTATPYEGEAWNEKARQNYAEYAEECRQLAQWLTELKEAKRLLKMAVEDINYYVDCYEAHCDECCCSQDNHCHWKHEAAVLKLIGETNDEP